LPLGLISFRLQLEEPGQTATTTIYFSDPLPSNLVWYKYDVINGWVDYSSHATIRSDRKSVVLEYLDGGYGDADGVANGIIVDPSGPVDTQTLPSSACFLDTLL
jgi:hypothetical protein